MVQIASKFVALTVLVLTVSRPVFQLLKVSKKKGEFLEEKEYLSRLLDERRLSFDEKVRIICGRVIWEIFLGFQ